MSMKYNTAVITFQSKQKTFGGTAHAINAGVAESVNDSKQKAKSMNKKGRDVRPNTVKVTLKYSKN